MPIFAWNGPFALNFLQEISSLSHSVVILYFFALITEEGLLTSLCCSWNSVIRWIYLSFYHLPFTSLLFSAIYKASSDYHFAFMHFFLEMVLIITSYTMSWTSVHSSSGILSIRSNSLNLLVTCTVSSKVIWFRLSGLVVFPTFFNLSLNLAIRSSWSELLAAPGLIFADCIELIHLWLQRM